MAKDDLKGFALRTRESIIKQVTENICRFSTAKESKALDDLFRDVQKKGFESVVEDIARIWFNRFICIWYMEVNGYLPPGTVLSAGALTKQCKKLAEIIPYVFENNLGYEQLLITKDFIEEGSIIRDMKESIDREAFINNVQITGWLYQYFISPRKDKIYRGLKKNRKITKGDIPTATQFFTPDWIVKYMVENSLGRLWLNSYPDSGLKAGWHYYIDEEEQELGTRGPLQKGTDKERLLPEDIKFMDPAMGSGHILAYAFDVLYDIYLSRGYAKDIIPSLILEKNLYGLDIDDRVTGLACFALMMKARDKDKHFLQRGIILKLYSLQGSGGLAVDDVVSPAHRLGGVSLPEGCLKDIELLLETFRNAQEFGSVINIPDMDLARLQRWWETLGKHIAENNDMQEICVPLYRRILSLIEQAKVMQDKYHVVATNPPYMGIRGMNPRLSNYLSTYYKYSKYDLFTVFMDLALNMTLKGGYLSLINQHSWMFLSSYKGFRDGFIRECCIYSMLHLGTGAFGEGVGTIVQSTVFVAKRVQVEGYRSIFMDLQRYRDSYSKERALLGLEYGHSGIGRYTVCISDLEGIPGKPIAYWACQRVISAFRDNSKLWEVARPRQGMATSDNNRFVRYWYEVPFRSIGFGYGSTEEARLSGYKWFPYNKGGTYRKWYGNNSMVVNWEGDGKEIKELASSLYGSYTRTIKNLQYYFQEAITYTFISTNLGARYSPQGFIFDVAGSSIFASKENLYLLLALLCSKPLKMFLELLNPTFNIQVGDIKNLPIVDIQDDTLKDEIVQLAKENIEISKTDWDFKETSWDFKVHPLLQQRKDSHTVEEACLNYERRAEGLIDRLRQNEERLNMIFIKLYGLEGIVSPKVEDKDITIDKPEKGEILRSFISYAVGCMFGRFILTGDGFLCKDNKNPGIKGSEIIPITGAGCMKGSILQQFIKFIRTTFGEENLLQNLGFIAGGLGRKKGESDVAAIGRYLENSFYKDHLNRYNRRPVYWLFDAGKQKSFKALVYFHRFNSSTLLIMREQYLRSAIKSYKGKLYNKKTLRDDEVLNSTEEPVLKVDAPFVSTEGMKAKKTINAMLKECTIYDRAISEAIRRGIDIDPNEGVINSYEKFQNILINPKGKEKPLKINLLARRKP